LPCLGPNALLRWADEIAPGLRAWDAEGACRRRGHAGV